MSGRIESVRQQSEHRVESRDEVEESASEEKETGESDLVNTEIRTQSDEDLNKQQVFDAGSGQKTDATSPPASPGDRVGDQFKGISAHASDILNRAWDYVELKWLTDKVPKSLDCACLADQVPSSLEDSWESYRMICGLVSTRKKYEETFRTMQFDPLYPYLNSLAGMNDLVIAEREHGRKHIRQKNSPKFRGMERLEVCTNLAQKALLVRPRLIEICKSLAVQLSLEVIGIAKNPKSVSAAMFKADLKYDGDVLKVTDYCRAYLVVKDIPTLLALLELVFYSFGSKVRRIKLAALKSDSKPVPGGYRDCKINLEVNGHICEIQVHLFPMWKVCGLNGYQHYRECKEISADSIDDPYDTLDQFQPETLASLFGIARDTTATDVPLQSLEWDQETSILNYFAKAGIAMKIGLASNAESIFRKLIQLRCVSPDMGPHHSETVFLKKHLAQALIQQRKEVEAQEVENEVVNNDPRVSTRERLGKKRFSFRRSLLASASEVFKRKSKSSHLPKESQQEEERMDSKLEASEREWHKLRKSRFSEVLSKYDWFQSNETNGSTVLTERLRKLVQHLAGKRKVGPTVRYEAIEMPSSRQRSQNGEDQKRLPQEGSFKEEDQSALREPVEEKKRWQEVNPEQQEVVGTRIADHHATQSE